MTTAKSRAAGSRRTVPDASQEPLLSPEFLAAFHNKDLPDDPGQVADRVSARAVYRRHRDEVRHHARIYRRHLDQLELEDRKLTDLLGEKVRGPQSGQIPMDEVRLRAAVRELLLHLGPKARPADLHRIFEIFGITLPYESGFSGFAQLVRRVRRELHWAEKVVRGQKPVSSSAPQA